MLQYSWSVVVADLVTRNPKKHEENLSKCVGFMGKDWLAKTSFAYGNFEFKNLNMSFWQHCYCDIHGV